jgi:uncharacterized membrane protein
MTATTYFRRALLLPILVPLIATIVILMYTRLAWPPIRSDTVATFLAALAISGVYSLIPYGIAAAWLYRQSKREEADWKYWQALWVTPLVVTVLSMLVAILLDYLAGGETPTGRSWIYSAPILVGIAGLVIGYGYALLVSLGYLGLTRAGIVHPISN